MELTKKCVLVFGTGISGIGAAHLLLARGAEVILYDGNTEKDKEALLAEFPAGSKVRIVLGELPEAEMEQLDLVVMSPGVPCDLPVVLAMKGKGIRIWGEVELAYECGKGDVLAVTGTNGKTTTTSLLGAIMQAYYPEVYIVGNIGNPYTEAAPKMTDDAVTVAEISSFQLETIEKFAPKVSAILNITPDHLNRHHTMEEYIRVKELITKNQTESDTCVLNYEDGYTRAFGEKCPAKVVYFSSRRELPEGIYLKGEDIYLKENGAEEKLLNIHELTLVGICNVENVMAAIAIAEGMQVPMETILTVIRGFHAVEHRIEFVATKGGVDYYNDSKGTNPDAAIQGIKAMSKPTVLIGGGYDKQSEYDEWIDSFDGKVKCLVLIGQTREKIAECARKHGFDKIRFADTYEECLKLCTELAQPGEAVLLSPACASWGMFPNYEVRGQLFKEYVHGLAE